MPTDVRVFDAPSALAEAAADLTLELAEAAVRERGRFVWGLAGGSTPRALYETLAKPPYAAAMPWRAIHVFWGDERCVPADHPDSNQRMAREALLNAVAPASIVPIPTENATPAESAAAAERGLRRLFNSDNDAPPHPRQEVRRRAGGLFNDDNADPPRPDLLLLGIGSDGHTASLFPGTDALDETERLFAANWIPQLGAWRVTATLLLINAARRIVFLAQGHDKADAVRKALHPASGAPPLPAALAAPTDGAVTWLLDREAAAKATTAY